MLRANLLKYEEQVQVADMGIPGRENISIYGDRSVVEQRKVGHLVRGYGQTVVYRDPDSVRNAALSFDATFDEVHAANASEAARKGMTVTELLVSRIDQIINAPSRSADAGE